MPWSSMCDTVMDEENCKYLAATPARWTCHMIFVDGTSVQNSPQQNTEHAG